MRHGLMIGIAIAAVVSGCRTAGPTVTITDSPGAWVRIDGTSTTAEQGKQVPFDVARGAKLQMVPTP